MKRLAVAIVLACAPASARAVELRLLDAPLRLNVNEYATVAYHVDNGSIAPPGSVSYDPTGSGYYDWLNRFELDGSWKDFTALLRLDSVLFAQPPQAAPGDTRLTNLLANRFGNRVDVEKAAVGYTSRHLEVTLGDAYATYGRGLVLALRREDELGVDTTVRGVSATGRVEGLNVNALGGWANIINVDQATGREADDPGDVILGSRAEYRFGKWVVPGVDVAHIIYPIREGSDATTHDTVTAYSGTLELPYLFGFGNAYVEYARQRRTLAGVTQEHSAVYASATGYLGRATLLVEYKNYHRYDPIPTSVDALAAPEIALTDYYNAPPVLERVQQPVLNNSDVTGPHARLEVAVTDAFAPFVSMAGFDDRYDHARIYDPYAGFELKWGARSRASLSGGYRKGTYDDTSKVPDQNFQTTLHFEYDVNQELRGPYSVELDGLHMGHDDLYGFREQKWIEGQSYLSLKRAELWSVAAGYEYYTEFPATVRPSYVNLSGAVNVADGVLVRMFAGGQRAGIKCVNGVCRNYPAFDGVRAEVVAKF